MNLEPNDKEIVSQYIGSDNIYRSNNREHKRPYSAFAQNDTSQKHYNVRFLKYLPTKVLINGRLRDRMSLTAEERQAVKNQEEIDKARANLQKEIELQRKQQDTK